jgi:hypothetical protein
MLPSKTVSLSLSLGLLLASVAIPAGAQSLVMTLPRQSQRAAAMQRIGLTDITVTYHRPLVGGRKVWDGMVPYGQVWRAGANENTTIEFSDPVTVEGQALPKGIYGLHMIPTADSWTIIFSKASTAWGSFTYDQKEDALRVTVKPQAGEFHEALAYDFDDVKDESTLVTLRWEKVAVPFRVAVAGKEVTLQNIRNQLRNTAQYTWMGWDDAANYCLSAKSNLEEGLRWADRSIQAEERFENLMTKAKLLEAMNRGAEATTARNKALEIGSAIQLYSWARQLQTQKRKSEAIDGYRIVARRFPEHWIGHVAKARVHAADGDFENALKEIQAAKAAGVPDPTKPSLEVLQKRLENKEDVNG